MDKAREKAIRRQTMFWLLAFFVFLFFLWLLGDILLPFIAGMALAYFLDPVADLLERWGVGRLTATTIILLVFVIVFVVTLMVLIPILGVQISVFLEALPDYVSKLQKLVTSADYPWLKPFKDVENDLIGESTSELVKQGAGWIGALLERLWASGKALVSIFSLLLVTPVVAFYLLYDWDNMIEKVDGWLPLEHRDTIRSLAHDIDLAVAGFVRGQGTLCLILGAMYGIALTIVGLNFGLLIGIFAGLISFIPYVGSITGLVLSLGVALVQFWPDYTPIIIVAVIFAAGQFIEGNLLQPKLVGDRVGLHPVWLMFALLAFGSLFGFSGLLIAVPASAAIGVIVRYMIDRYKNSELYYGHDGAHLAKNQNSDDNDSVG